MGNVYLVGMPGSGKTTFGKISSGNAGLPFVDLDEVVKQNMGMSIDEIFANFGEVRFRDEETKALIETSKKDGVIVSTGGGAVLRDENIAIMKKTGAIIYINTPVDIIIKYADLQRRPLLKSNPSKIYDLYNQRHPIYSSCADAAVDVDTDFKKSCDTLKDTICLFLQG